MKKVLVTLLIISTVFTACKKDETPTLRVPASNPAISVPTLDGMYKTWPSSSDQSTAVDLQIKKLSDTYFQTFSEFSPELSNLYITVLDLVEDTVGSRDYQNLSLENTQGRTDGKFYMDNQWIEFYFQNTLFKARPFTEDDTLRTQKDTSELFELDSRFTISWEDRGTVFRTMYVWKDLSKQNEYYTTSSDGRFNGIRFSNITEPSRLSLVFDVGGNNGGSPSGTFSKVTGVLTFKYGSTPITGVAEK